MIKVVIHSPKGGVGKTTVATNAALLLASQGIKVLAYDFAQGGMMARFIQEKKDQNPQKYMSLDVREEELGELPSEFVKGGQDYDIMIADTDDYHKILENLVDPKKRGWRAIAPILPPEIDEIGAKRIPEELAAVATKEVLTQRKFPLRILPNRCNEEDIQSIRQCLEDAGIGSLMSQYYLPDSSSQEPPIFWEEDSLFCQQLTNVLRELGFPARKTPNS
jgi:chromosome partitioning protein